MRSLAWPATFPATMHADGAPRLRGDLPMAPIFQIPSSGYRMVSTQPDFMHLCPLGVPRNFVEALMARTGLTDEEIEELESMID